MLTVQTSLTEKNIKSQGKRMQIQPVVILVQPQLAENMGMTARAMMNCGLYQLRLVSPRENHLSDKAVSASSGADEILQNAVVYTSTQEAVADLQQVYATTARHRDQIKVVHNAASAAKDITRQCQNGVKCGILFGPERTGLNNDDVALSDAVVEIPLNPKHCSLNLSQAVLLVGYEWYKQQIDTADTYLSTNGTEIADKEKLFKFFEFMEDKLQNNKNYQDDEKRPRMIRNLHNIFQRSQITTQELNTLYGIINHLSDNLQKK